MCWECVPKKGRDYKYSHEFKKDCKTDKGRDEEPYSRQRLDLWHQIVWTRDTNIVHEEEQARDANINHKEEQAHENSSGINNNIARGSKNGREYQIIRDEAASIEVAAKILIEAISKP